MECPMEEEMEVVVFTSTKWSLENYSCRINDHDSTISGLVLCLHWYVSSQKKKWLNTKRTNEEMDEEEVGQGDGKI